MRKFAFVGSLAALLALPVASLALAHTVKTRPGDIVALKEIDATIVQEMRYAGSHNFVGRPLPGYKDAQCWLTLSAAQQLQQVQAQLRASGLSLKVYDCTRPQRAVDEFIRWSRDPDDIKTKAEFYPHINKRHVFRLGYVAKRSGHSRGSTVDLTIIPLLPPAQPAYEPTAIQSACELPRDQRFPDNSIDMGTGYDCFHEKSQPASEDISIVAQHQRAMLAELMARHGFTQSITEWWHFTLVSEPYPDTYFDFPLG